MKKLFFIILFFSCCTPHHSKQQSIKIGIFHQLTPLSPFRNSYSISTNILDLIFDSLIRISAKGDITPCLAKSWNINKNEHYIDFTIRSDVYFHDGSKLYPSDIYHSLIHAFNNSNTGLNNVFKPIKKLELIENNIRVYLESEDSSFWVALQSTKIVPEKQLMQLSTPNFNTTPIGSGPYRIIEQNEKHILLQANTNYFENNPKIKNIEFISFENEQAVLNQLIAQNIDFIFLLSPQDYGVLNKIKSLNIYSNWYPLLYSFMFNFKNSVFLNNEIRNALDLAINRQRIIDLILYQQGKLGYGTDITSSEKIPYNPLKAIEILKEQGWKLNTKQGMLENTHNQFFEFKVSFFSGDDISKKTLDFIKEDLLKIGIKVTSVPLSGADFHEKVFKQKSFDAAILLSAYKPYFQNEYGYFHSSQIQDGINFSSYNDPLMDQLLEEYRSNPNNSNIYHQMQTLLVNHKPALFLFWRNMPIVADKRFKGIPQEKMESLRDLMYVYEE